jgi:citrate synthase
MLRYYSAWEEAQHLGVSRRTLYSYVSRGILRAHTSQKPRERRYLVDEVAQLARKHTRGRKPREIAEDALNWGLPVVESAICLIADGRLFYRGKDVLDLIETESVEDVAALLWNCPAAVAFAATAPALPKDFPAMASKCGYGAPDASLAALFALATRQRDGAARRQDADCDAREYGDLVRLLAACLLRAPVGVEPLHEACARAWSLSARGAQIVRRALILCADHELNASSFTVRCIASTGASLHAAVAGGLAALSGIRHGGATYLIEALWNEIAVERRAEPLLRAHLQSGSGPLPGFGHPLYPEGDVRAIALLSQIPGRRTQWQRVVDRMDNLTGLRPNVDFALVALRRYLELPEGAAFGIFALGRSIGWLAHALEQRKRDAIIRPRAAYVGPPPEKSTRDQR